MKNTQYIESIYIIIEIYDFVYNLFLLPGGFETASYRDSLFLKKVV